MASQIDFSEFRELNNFNDKQPLFPFVEVTIGGVTVSDFDSDYGGSVMDLSYRRTAHQDTTDVSGDTFTITLYDDTAIQVESLIYNVILKTTHQAEENLNDPNSENNTTITDGNVDEPANNSSSESNSNSDNTLRSFFTTGRSVFGSPEDLEYAKEGLNNNKNNNDSKSDDNNTTDNNTDNEGGEKSDEDLWIEALEEINNIDISYGWVDMKGNRLLDRNINGHYAKYSMEFEGASTILTIEGESVASAGLNSPSTSWISDYPASDFQGNPAKIVKSIIDATPTVSYTKDSIEETESILGEDGKPKSFTRNGETPEEFIKKYLCEEAKSKVSGKVGYQFFIREKVAYFIPNETPKEVSVETKTNIKAQGQVTVQGVTSANNTEYDLGSSGVDITNKSGTLGASFSDNKEFRGDDYYEEYDELDEFDVIDENELDEDDLPEDIDDTTGLLQFVGEDFENFGELDYEVIDTDIGDFESDMYLDMEYDIETDSIIDADATIIPEEDEIDTEEGDSTEEEDSPIWLRKFGMKLEL